MTSKTLVALAALLGFLVVVRALKRKDASRRLSASDECAVSECGPDGVPLSLYAG